MRYLLSGLLVCSVCGAKFAVTGGEGRRHYICGSYHSGGAAACTNGLRISQVLAEELIVEPVLAILASGKVDATVAGVKQRKGRRSEPVRRANPELPKARARIADLEKMVSACVMTAAEAEGPLARARAAVDQLEREAHVAPVVDLAVVAEEFRGWAGKLRRALGAADVGQAREALRQLVGEITLRPHTDRGVRRALKPEQTLGELTEWHSGVLDDWSDCYGWGRGIDGAGGWLRRRGLKRKTVTGIAAGTWEDRYLVAKFTRRVGELPLHPVLTAEWFRAAGLSHQNGSGGRI